MSNSKTCLVDGCDNEAYCKGYCRKHYTAFKRHGDANHTKKKKICSVEGCSSKHYGKGLCKLHYEKVRVTGTLEPCSKTRGATPNDYLIHEDYAEIIITDKDGKEKCKTKIDIEDVEKCKPFRWNDSGGYVSSSDGKRLHRFIMNCPDDLIVDHIYHDTLDNRKSELRICTNQQNCMNQVKRSDNTSGEKGISWDKGNEKWRVQIKKEQKRIHIGYYFCMEDAIQARDKAQQSYFGEWAERGKPQ